MSRYLVIAVFFLLNIFSYSAEAAICNPPPMFKTQAISGEQPETSSKGGKGKQSVNNKGSGQVSANG